MAYKDGSRTVGGRHYHQHQSLKKFIREWDNYTCQLCGAEGWIVDHIIPYSVSHDSTISNLRVLCHACNLVTRRKQASKTIPYAEYESYLRRELALSGSH